MIVRRGRRRNDCNKEVIPNPRPIKRLCILSGENMQGMRRDVALPILDGVAFCKRWHMGNTCFGDFPRAVSHLHPMGDIVDEVAEAIVADQAAREATALIT